MKLEELKEHNQLYKEFDAKFSELVENFGAVAKFANENTEDPADCYTLDSIGEILETFKDLREVFAEAMSDRYDLIIKLKDKNDGS